MKLLNSASLLALGLFALTACDSRNAVTSSRPMQSDVTTQESVRVLQDSSSSEVPFEANSHQDRLRGVTTADSTTTTVAAPRRVQAQEYIDNSSSSPDLNQRDRGIPTGKKEGAIDNTSSEPDADQL